MANNKEPNIWRLHVVNGIIVAVFGFVRFGISPLLGWEINTTYLIGYFSLLSAALLLVGYFVYLRPYQLWKSTTATHSK